VTCLPLLLLRPVAARRVLWLFVLLGLDAGAPGGLGARAGYLVRVASYSSVPYSRYIACCCGLLRPVVGYCSLLWLGKGGAGTLIRDAARRAELTRALIRARARDFAGPILLAVSGHVRLSEGQRLRRNFAGPR
jgi:hypothetical protein